MEEVLEISTEHDIPFRRVIYFVCGCLYTLDLPQGCGKAVPNYKTCGRHTSFRWVWTRDSNGQVQRIPKGGLT